MKFHFIPNWLNPKLPFYYGWIILFCVCCAGFARQGPAVATLSIFISPMASEFGWSFTAVSSAVSFGGILAAVSSPFLGLLLDKNGSRTILCISIIITGFTVMLISLTQSLFFFFTLFCIARMNFAGPFDLGIYGAVNNWFIKLRGFATSVTTFIQMTGLMAMPLIAQACIQYDGWRFGWVIIGTTVLFIGFLPNFLLMVRKPEDLDLLPDGDHQSLNGNDENNTNLKNNKIPEPVFTRNEALKTRAFWVLSVYTIFVFPVQAGISLHQAPHLIERGIEPYITATIVATFSLFSALSGMVFGLIVRKITIRFSLFSAALCLAFSSTIMIFISVPWQGYLAVAFFGTGIGGILTILPIAWADFFGRASFGAIRGVALFFQVTAQASGPLMSGVLRDFSGDYYRSLIIFVVFSLSALFISLFAIPPKF